MKELEFTIDKDFIGLNKLLKIMALVESGGQANAVISDGYVTYNGAIDTRKRLKVRKGDLIHFADTKIRIS